MEVLKISQIITGFGTVCKSRKLKDTQNFKRKQNIMQSNSHITKFNKVNRFNHEEAQERIGKGKKLNKVKRQSKRDLWNDEE